MINTNQKLPLKEREEASVLDVFCKVLKKRRLKYELKNNGKTILFTYKRNQYVAFLDLEEDSVDIVFIHDIFIDKKDETKLARLGRLVNGTNKICPVQTYYEENEDTDFVFVLSRSSINFITQNSNLEIELIIILDGCLLSKDLIKSLMKRKYNRRKKQDEKD